MPKCADCIYCELFYSPERDRKVYCCTEPSAVESVEKFGLACKEIEDGYLDNNLCPDFVPNEDVDNDLYKKAMSAIREYAENDPVEHPAHYTQGGIECIDAEKAALGDLFMGFLIGNALKYLWRFRHKNGLEDLNKARWYLDRAIKEMEENENGERNES